MILLLVILAKLGMYDFSLRGLLFVTLVVVLYLTAALQEAYRVIFLGKAPYLRSSKALVNRILQEVDFRAGSQVYELGCGDGRFLRNLVKVANVNCIGYEYSLPPYLLGKIFNVFSRKKIKIYYKNFFKANLADADYIFCYLIAGEMDDLERKLKNELKDGCLVISNTFALKNWQPEKVILINENSKKALSNKIYIYKK